MQTHTTAAAGGKPRASAPPHPTSQHHTTLTSPGALAMGLLCAALTAGVLLDDVRQGAPLTLDHALGLGVMAITLAAGHMAWPHIRQGRFVGLMLGVIFLGGSAWIGIKSGARNAEVGTARAAATVQANRDRAAIETEIAAAKADHARAKAAEAVECATGEGKACKGRRSTTAAAWSHVTLLEARLGLMQPAQEDNAGYRHAARVIAAFTGADAKAIAERLILGMPALLVLVIEIATITFVGAAFAAPAVHGPSDIYPARHEPSDHAGQSDYPAVGPLEAAVAATFLGAGRSGNGHGHGPSGGPSGPRPGPRPNLPGPSDGRKSEVLAAMLTDLALGRSAASQRELCERFGIARSTMSDWLAEWERSGLIPHRRTVGRCKTLPASC